jgi:hypothetical protein
LVGEIKDIESHSISLKGMRNNQLNFTSRITNDKVIVINDAFLLAKDENYKTEFAWNIKDI